MTDVQTSTAAEAGGGIASQLMAPNPGVIIWVWVVFVVLLVLLHKFAWKPILASVAERERKLKESLAKADEVAAMAASSEAEQQRILAETRAEATRRNFPWVWPSASCATSSKAPSPRTSPNGSSRRSRRTDVEGGTTICQGAVGGVDRLERIGADTSAPSRSRGVADRCSRTTRGSDNSCRQEDSSVAGSLRFSVRSVHA